MTNYITGLKIELVDFLVNKRMKALRKQNMSAVYEYTLWINHINRQASSREIAEYYCEYWNSHKAAQYQSSEQLPLF